MLVGEPAGGKLGEDGVQGGRGVSGSSLDWINANFILPVALVLLLLHLPRFLSMIAQVCFNEEKDLPRRALGRRIAVWPPVV